MGLPAPVRYLCITDIHLHLGRSVPDEQGYITIHDGQWAYCSAARPAEPHVWGKIPPTPLFSLRHGTLRRKYGGADLAHAASSNTTSGI